MAKILLVEDIADNATLVKKAVQAKEHEFFWAQNATEGLRMALEIKPDLILLDLGLPDVDGQTLSTWIKDEKELWNIPLIVMTAWPETTALQMVEAYNLDGYISKPFNLKAFWKTINEFLPS